ncbi:hypothetical protein FEM48_Zijuj06G0163600 [Ziziphus jujuba var. spinosa]|uniref:Uncharacterized protein n=1 Tax=Ziziphus jujuba var. spinosa TaxID=714518 RepID=A0A978VAC2_ZIZJJ|nr:hypothetical protein FEM48_Zijuj06G0163600 [Ziziphus jujuba var. spinosa]
MNSSRSEKQETIQPDLHQDVRTNTTHEGNVTKPTVLDGEKNFGHFNEIRKFDSDTSSDFDSFEEGIVDEPEEEATGEPFGYYWNNDNERLNMAATKRSLFSIANHSIEEAFSSPTSTIGSSETAQQESLALSSVENITGMRKKPVRTRKHKGNATLARNKTNLSCKTTYDAIRPSEKKKPSPKNKNSIRDSNNSLVLSNQRTSNAGRRGTSVHALSQRQLSEACSSSTSLPRNRLLNSSPSSSSDHSSSDHTKASQNHQDFVDNFFRLLSIGVQSVQSPPKERAVLGGLEHKARENRFTKLPVQNKLKQNNGVELGQRNYIKEKKQKEVTANFFLVWQDISNVKLGRDPKSATNKAHDAKLELTENRAFVSFP